MRPVETMGDERMIDVERLRADTPACERTIHFNNAGASLMPDPVYRALVDHLTLECELGGYEAAARAAAPLERFYANFATLLNCEPSEIAWCENATRAWDMAFYGLPLQEGDRIVTHASEYASNYLAFLQQARRRGLHIDVAPSDASGQIDVDALDGLIGTRTRLIAITHVPTQGALVNPAEEVGRVAREHGLFYLLDACQSVGQRVVDVQAIGCHVLSGTGRKFLRGPRGTGFLYVSNEIVDRIEPPFIDLHAARWTSADAYELAPGARRFENWESYVAGRLGLSAAVGYALDCGVPAIEARIATLAETLRDALEKRPDTTVHDRGRKLSGIVTFTVAGESATRTAERLAAAGINVSVSRATSSQLDLGARGLHEIVRASLHAFNTHEEIERFLSVV